jgi:hypothetical protein
LEAIKVKIAAGNYTVAFTHTEKLRRRRVRARDIEQAFAVGEIIEAYPDDLRGPVV